MNDSMTDADMSSIDLSKVFNFQLTLWNVLYSSDLTYSISTNGRKISALIAAIFSPNGKGP